MGRVPLQSTRPKPMAATCAESFDWPQGVTAGSTDMRVQGYLAHKKPHPLGPYSRPVSMDLRWSHGVSVFS